MIENYDKQAVSFSIRTSLLALLIAMVAALASAAANADTSDQPWFVISDMKTVYVVVTEDGCNDGKCDIKNTIECKIKKAKNREQHDVRSYPDSVTYRHELPRKKF